MSKMSSKQQRILEMVANACIPQSVGLMEPERVIPLYSGHLPDVFLSDAEERRFLENLEARGFLRIEKRHFLYITNKGLAALGREPAPEPIAQAAQPAAPPAILYLRDEACGSASGCNRWYGSSLAEAGEAWRELSKDGRQVWLLCLGVAGQLASHEEMQWRFGTPKSDFACPVCGKGTPHQHSAQAIELRRYGDEVTAREMDKRWAEIERLVTTIAARQ